MRLNQIGLYEKAGFELSNQSSILNKLEEYIREQAFAKLAIDLNGIGITYYNGVLKEYNHETKSD